MRAVLILSSLILILVSTSCDRTPGIFAQSEDQIIGQWEYKRATYRERDRLNGMDQTARFQHDILTFYQDRTVELLNTWTGEVKRGQWQINVYFEWDGDSNDRVEELQLTFVNENGQNEVQYWDDLFVSYNRVRGKERLPDAVWTYVLRSLD